MQPAENKDYSRDVILRLSPTRNTIIVEEQKPGGIAAYREIDPLELYYVINQSYASNDYLDSGFLPEHCLHLSMSATEKYFVLWNPELRADVIYGDKEYPNFPIPRMVFGVRVLENGKSRSVPWASLRMNRQPWIRRCSFTPFPMSIRMIGSAQETMCCRGIERFPR